jgi:hypothetical protein
MQFMSLEAVPQVFLFGPTRGRRKLDTTQESAEQAMRSRRSDAIPWSHNHLHDLESLWWVAVWMLIYHHFQHSNEPLPGVEEMELSIDQVQTLFPPTMENIRRRDAFQQTFLDVYETLPGNKRPAFLLLDDLREDLISDYTAVESTLPTFINLHAADDDDIYEKFQDAFRRIKTENSDYKLLFIPDLIQAKTAGKIKRPREESFSVTGGSSSKRSRVA